ncbi:MAG: Crp/Fnr family transcriptional regulator [Flavobacteriales bacterium]
MQKKLQTHYQHIFEKALLEDILEVGSLKEVPEGHTLIDIGSYIKGIPLILSGVIKVLREDDNGDELLLYYLEHGETCSVTMTCCMGHTKSEIKATTETATQLIMIPVGNMEIWASKYKSWRNFVFESYHTRLNELLYAVDNIAFRNMDKRLINYLREKVRVNLSHSIKSTHQDIAHDLNSSRVVISRLLKTLENAGCLTLHRNYIQIINLDLAM